MFLHSWACEVEMKNVNWRDTLLEALCIIQAKAIIRKLGLNYVDLEQRFLPLTPTNALFIHPIVKLLFLVNDQLTITEAKMLVDRIARGNANGKHFNCTDNHLMFWLGEDVLLVDRPTTTIYNNNSVALSNWNAIHTFLKEIEKDSLKEMVSSVIKRNASIDRPTTQTDDRQPIDVGILALNINAESIRAKNADDSFKIRKPNAGVVLIVNQKTFHHDESSHLQEFLPTRMLETRCGTDQDVASLHRTFSAFGYRIEEKENLNHTDLLNAVRDAVNECVGKDSLIVCILSHGYKGVVYGANSIPVSIEDIEHLMISPRLVGKPKILIVQACQGDVTQQAREVSATITITSNWNRITDSIVFHILMQIDYLQHDGPSLPIFSDLLTCISSVPGHTSIRHTEEGSWFIQVLCRKITELAAHKHFADILTVVGREVQNLRGRNNQCMSPIFRSTLRMQLFFPFN